LLAPEDLRDSHIERLRHAREASRFLLGEYRKDVLTYLTEMNANSQTETAEPANCGDAVAELDRSPRRQAASESGLGEILFVGCVIVLTCLLRIRYASQVGFNSDEPQHLHVVWGWTSGLLQYRDVFDNHAPLFDILLAPVLRLIGERAEVLIWMRLAMLPLFLASLWAVFEIGKSVFSRRVGLWAVLVAAVFPHFERENGRVVADALFFFKMGEFRTDVLWTMFWLCSLAVLLRGRLGAGRCFWFGVLLGAALAVSMKTILMLVTVAMAAVVICLFAICERRVMRQPALLVAAALAGFVVIPSLIIAYFAAKNGLAAMHYCIVTHNEIPGSSVFDRARHSWRYIMPRVVVLIMFAGWVYRTARTSLNPRNEKRAFLVLIAGFYYVAVCGLWPIITPQDFQPSDPVFAICVTSLLVAAGEYLEKRFTYSLARYMPAGAVVIAGLAMILHEESLFQHRTEDEVAMVGDVLRLTKPGEQVIDAKGECIYRPRGWYMVLETIARKKLRMHLLKDDLVETTVQKRIPLAHGFERMLDEDRGWFERHYVQVGHVFVAGEILKPAPTAERSFEVVIPETYAVVADSGPVRGLLDGKPVTGPVRLEAGYHEFLSQDGHASRRFAVVWARAVEKGYSPFGGVPHS